MVILLVNLSHPYLIALASSDICDTISSHDRWPHARGRCKDIPAQRQCPERYTGPAAAPGGRSSPCRCENSTEARHRLKSRRGETARLAHPPCQGGIRFAPPTPRVTKPKAPSGLIVDLKYVTSKQKFALEYEGNISFFEVDAVSSQSYDKNTPGDLVSLLQGLKFDPAPQIWIVGWDTTVVVLPADTPKPLESVGV